MTVTTTDKVASPEPTSWHTRTAEDVAAELASPDEGLTQADIAERRRRFGPNRLTPPPATPAWRRFLAQFENMLIIVLIGGGIVTLLLGEYIDATVIAAVVLINAIIGYVQEGKAEQALSAIRGMLAPQAVVVRDSRQITVPSDDLVPGDRVMLASGDRIPADLRLVRSRSLYVQEAALTGESVPVTKEAEALPTDTPLAERSCMAYSGTLVTRGQAVGLVVATGDRTELGRIGVMLAGMESVTTPLLQQMENFGRWLSIIVVAIAVLTLLYGVFVQGGSWVEMIMAAIGLAVAAIPEGLPAVMTITLAIGVTRMASRNAILRRLPAVETLGSVSVICSDKTGTLTRNELTVRQLVLPGVALAVDGEGYEPVGAIRPLAGGTADPPAVAGAETGLTALARAALLCNDADLHQAPDGCWVMAGDPTDGALLALALKTGASRGDLARYHPRTDLIPFESDHKFMATLHRNGDGSLILMKGAPERVLDRCDTEIIASAGGETGFALKRRPIDRDSWRQVIDQLASQGMRVLALAERPLDIEQTSIGMDDVESGLTLVGLCGLIDPPRAEAVAAVEQCQAAGIRVKMITGDHGGTAEAIGKSFGLRGPAVTGAELDRLDEAELTALLRNTDIFARTSPEHKLRIVKALQKDGLSVSMTGDGVNDAPALKRADVGVAMGRSGTEAAKEASGMVLADDNFASIAHAVEEGRTVYDNLRKTILFMLPTNGAQALVILLAVLTGMLLPITPVQILWVNMVSAVTLGLALAFEKPEADVMRRPPRPRGEALLPGFAILRMALAMLLMVAASFGFFLTEMAGASPDLDRARTLAVNALVLAEVAFLFNARSVHASVLNRAGLFGSRPVWIAIGLIALFQGAFTYVGPMQDLFGTTALGLGDWLALAGAAVVLLLVIEGEKAITRRRLA